MTQLPHPQRAFSALLLVPALFLCACGSMLVNRIPETLKDPKDPNKTILEREGVIVQVSVPYEVVTVLRDAQGERVVKATVVSLPAADEFYEIGFKGGAFNARELAIELHPNGTLKEYNFTKTQKVSDSVQNLADAAVAVAKARKEIEDAEEAPPNPVASENAELQLQLLNTMLKANLAALEEGRPLPFPEILQD